MYSGESVKRLLIIHGHIAMPMQVGHKKMVLELRRDGHKINVSYRKWVGDISAATEFHTVLYGYVDTYLQPEPLKQKNGESTLDLCKIIRRFIKNPPTILAVAQKSEQRSRQTPPSSLGSSGALDEVPSDDDWEKSVDVPEFHPYEVY